MSRSIVLSVLMTAGAFSLAVTASQAPQPTPGPKVVEVQKVKDNLYMLTGADGGGNTAVFVATKGVVVVDTKNPGWGQPVLDKIKTLTDKPVTTIINTHTHGDHVSGNVEFPATVEVVTHQNAKASMEPMDIFKKNAGKGLPKKTFKDKMSLMSGNDKIDLYYFGPGHTSGDALVVFPALRTMHTGDLFAGKSVPFMDGTNGGSAAAYPQTLAKTIAGIKNVETIISGHSPTTLTWNDLKEFGDFVKDFVSWAEAQMKAGKTADEATAAFKVPEKYQGYTPGKRVKGNIELLYKERKK